MVRPQMDNIDAYTLTKVIEYIDHMLDEVKHQYFHVYEEKRGFEYSLRQLSVRLEAYLYEAQLKAGNTRNEH